VSVLQRQMGSAPGTNPAPAPGQFSARTMPGSRGAGESVRGNVHNLNERASADDAPAPRQRCTAGATVRRT
jgi:hypothetical protein